MITFVAVVAVLLALAWCGYEHWERVDDQAVTFPTFSLASAESQPVICTDAATRDKIKGVMLDALDDALKKHIVHMFEIWMKDDRGQPERARNGVVNGVNAYL